MLIDEKLKTINLTNSEKEIVNYFLEEKENLNKKSVREISKKVYCSPSSIVRLCQKLGFTGFEEFKEAYIKELNYLEMNFTDVDANIPFEKEDGIQTIANKIKLLYQEIVDDTYSLNEHDALRKTVTLIKETQNLYVVASGQQINIARTFRDKMGRIGKHVCVFENVDEAYYEVCYLSKEDVCFILISYTGETRDCIQIAKKLNERKIDFITITSFGSNTLSSLSHCILHVSTRERIRDNLGAYSMSLSTLYLLDVIYSMYFSLNYSENKVKKINNSKEFETLGLSVLRDTHNDLIK